MVQSQAENSITITITIATLARAGDVGVETVRYYQRRGLLRTPERAATGGSGGGIRKYDAEDVRKLRFIKSAQAAGFRLEEISELIRLDAVDDRPRVRLLAHARIEALDAEIAKLKSARQSLAHLAHECGAGASGPCPILMAFDLR